METASQDASGTVAIEIKELGEGRIGIEALVVFAVEPDGREVASVTIAWLFPRHFDQRVGWN